MPKRSNYFQRLVLLVRTHVAAGATVTESKELVDKVTGIKREVDICIEGSVGGVPTVISIECRAFTRKADVTWVEEMTSKHNNLPTDVLILYSRSGFTKSAVDKAKFYNKRIVALRALNDATAEGLFGGASSVWFKNYTLSPTLVIFSVPEAPGLAAENVRVFPDHIIFNRDEQPIGLVSNIVELCLRAPDAQEKRLRLGNESHKSFELHSKPPAWKGEPIYLLKNDVSPPVLRPVELIKTFGGANFDVGEFQMQHGKLDNITVAWGTGLIKGQEALLVASKDEKAEMKLSLSYAKQKPT
jgi:hypothetical protein